MAEELIISDDFAQSLGHVSVESQFRFVHNLAVTMVGFIRFLGMEDTRDNEVMEWYFQRLVTRMFNALDFDLNGLSAKLKELGYPVFYRDPWKQLHFLLLQSPEEEGIAFLRYMFLNIPIITLHQISDLMRVQEI